jgi:hypothetical protein
MNADYHRRLTDTVTQGQFFLNLDGFVKSSNSRHANFAVMRRTCCTLNDGDMQQNAEVGLFTKPSH